jgi:hypothetical protein
VSKREKKKGPVVEGKVDEASATYSEATDQQMHRWLGKEMKQATPEEVVGVLTEYPKLALKYDGQVAPWLEEAFARVRASYSTDEERAEFDAWRVRCHERARYLSEVAHWDAWGAFGVHHINRPERDCKPEAAMKLLLEKARSMFGEQDWSAWEWRAHEQDVQFKRVIRFTRRDGTWARADE